MHRKFLAAALTALLSPAAASAADLEITITNLSGGIHFTPLLVAAHPSAVHLFRAGEPASAALQAMAEGGDIAGLENEVSAAGGQFVADPAGGILGPASSSGVALLSTAAGNTHLSITAMLLPTNDGFVALDGWEIPTQAGSYTLTLNAYDAGTEANTELMNPGAGGAPGVSGIPGDPSGRAGSGGSGVVASAPNDAEANVVHVHRGQLGDTDAGGGLSDLDSRSHRWLNPVARVTVVVK
ncbi:MAG: spondin domain-containing protein [Zoogloeaceae bacterium]|nr:spondin domain-containing protein [Rhodocyclaceae bacterium]MCP5237083.1 spondin domain-containing protein [Zoogloeaceae bacterium]